MVDFSGKVLKKEVRKVNMKANSSTCVWEQDSASAATAQQRTDALLLLTLKDSKGKVLDKQTFYFEKPKALNLPETTVKQKVKYMDGACEVTLTSDKLAKDLFIEIPVQGAQFTDNFFDLLPGRAKQSVSPLPC